MLYFREDRGEWALRAAACREETLFPGTDRDVSGSGDTCWRQYTHYRGSHGGKSWMTNPVCCWAPQRSPVPYQPTPPLLLDVITAFNLITLSWLKWFKKTEISVPITTKSYLDLLQSLLTPCDSAERPLNHPRPSPQPSLGRWLARQSSGCFLLGR